MPSISSNPQFYALLAIGLGIGVLAMIIPLFIACYTFLQRFATKEDLAAQTQRQAADLAEQKHDQATESARLLALQTAMESRLVGDLAANTGKLDSLTASIQLWVNETNRATGQSEGRTELMLTLVKHQLKIDEMEEGQ